MPIELRDLRAFVAVGEELHFGRAALRLHISAPPLTRQIQKIEAQLGARLFDRTKRSVALTAAGRVLMDDARLLLQQADGLADRVQRVAQGDTGLLRVGVVGIALMSQAREAQRRIAQELPDVRVTWSVLSSADQVNALRQQRLDVGFVHTPIAHEGLAVRRLVREPLVVALPAQHALAASKSVRLGALRGEVFLIGTREQSPNDYDRLISGCNAAGFSPRLDLQRQSLASFIGLVAIGAGVAVTPASMALATYQGIAFVPIEGAGQYSEISMAWNPAQVSPVLARMLQWFETPARAAGGTQRPRRKR